MAFRFFFFGDTEEVDDWERPDGAKAAKSSESESTMVDLVVMVQTEG